MDAVGSGSSLPALLPTAGDQASAGVRPPPAVPPPAPLPAPAPGHAPGPAPGPGAAAEPGPAPALLPLAVQREQLRPPLPPVMTGEQMTELLRAVVSGVRAPAD